MRIYGPNATTVGTSVTARRTAGGTFTLPDAAAPAETRAASAPKPVTSLDALLALQGVEDLVERRRRAVKRGRSALDVLDDLKLGLLSGTFEPATLERLRGAARDLKDQSGDPGLDQVLAEIELRVEVELAKAGQA